MPWYQAEPFKTLLGVLVGGLLGGIVSLATSWWLKRLETKTKSDALKVAFQAEVSALRAALRVDLQEASEILARASGYQDPRTDVKYARVIFERNAGQIGDLRDTVLVRQVAGFYTMLDRLESLGSAPPIIGDRLEYNCRFMASLGSAFYLATLLDMRLIAQTEGLAPANFTLKTTDQDVQDQRLAKTTLAKYGTERERRVLGEKAP